MKFTKTIRNATITGLVALTAACGNHKPLLGVDLPADKVCLEYDRGDFWSPETITLYDTSVPNDAYATEWSGGASSKPHLTIKVSNTGEVTTTEGVGTGIGSRLFALAGQKEFQRIMQEAEGYLSRGYEPISCAEKYRAK